MRCTAKVLEEELKEEAKAEGLKEREGEPFFCLTGVSDDLLHKLFLH